MVFGRGSNGDRTWVLPLLAAVALATGCARTAGRPPAPAGASTPAPVAPAGAGTPAGTAAPLDPSEVMTPAELAAIPDPVAGPTPLLGEPSPATSASPSLEAGASGDSAGAADQVRVPEAPPAADVPNGGPGGASGGPSAGFLWRVQVFASPELAQADRVAKEAAARLGVPYVIQFEAKLYKVRLGSFPSESDAQGLRDRAIREGFKGAFRVRTTAEPTGGTD